MQADFHKMPFEDNSFDHCYSIEACCHSPDRRDVYREIMRVLKPGGTFVSYEWCLVRSPHPRATLARATLARASARPGANAAPSPRQRRTLAALSPHPRRANAAPRPRRAARTAHRVRVSAQTDQHDPKCEAHVFSKKLIEEGDGLPDIIHTKVRAGGCTPVCWGLHPYVLEAAALRAGGCTPVC